MTSDDETKLITLVISLLGMLAIILVAAVFTDCEWNDHRRQSCIEQTHDVPSCIKAFPPTGAHKE
jgi:hypothetical protein